jgi:hypothetical protein
MHASNLPFRYWFIAIHLLTSTKKSFSAAELQRQLGHKRYEPIWTLLHKLRVVMGKRDEQYHLEGMLELDEGFFTTETEESEKDKPLKRGRGSQRKTKVLVMAESAPVEGETTKKGKPRKVEHLKMAVIDDLKAGTITPVVEKSVSLDSSIDSDDSTSYNQLEKYSLLRSGGSDFHGHESLYAKREIGERLYGSLVPDEALEEMKLSIRKY